MTRREGTPSHPMVVFHHGGAPPVPCPRGAGVGMSVDLLFLSAGQDGSLEGSLENCEEPLVRCVPSTESAVCRACAFTTGKVGDAPAQPGGLHSFFPKPAPEKQPELRSA